MAREATITQEQVNAAADSLVKDGQKATNRAVLEVLGSGSMATVVKFMQVWRSGQSRQSQQINDEIDPAVAGAISNMIAKRIQEATSEANAKLAEQQSDLDAVIAENERQAAEIAELAAQLEAARAQCQTQAGQIEELKTSEQRLRDELTHEIKARESAQVALAKAELQIASLPELNEELKTARAESKRSGEEAAELRGRLAGLTEKRQS